MTSSSKETASPTMNASRHGSNSAPTTPRAANSGEPVDKSNSCIYSATHGTVTCKSAKGEPSNKKVYSKATEILVPTCCGFYAPKGRYIVFGELITTWHKYVPY